MKKHSHSRKRKISKKPKKTSRKPLKKMRRGKKKVKKILVLKPISPSIPTKHRLHGRRHFAVYGKKPA
jgi:hypothetical protein